MPISTNQLNIKRHRRLIVLNENRIEYTDKINLHPSVYPHEHRNKLEHCPEIEDIVYLRFWSVKLFPQLSGN